MQEVSDQKLEKEALSFSKILTNTQPKTTSGFILTQEWRTVVPVGVLCLFKTWKLTSGLNSQIIELNWILILNIRNLLSQDFEVIRILV